MLLEMRAASTFQLNFLKKFLLAAISGQERIKSIVPAHSMSFLNANSLNYVLINLKA
jgi:hypothetical protein